MSRAHGNDPIQTSEAELVAMTGELEEMHHATLPQMRAAAVEWTEEHREAGSFSPSRRGFLAGAAVAAGGLVLAACGSSGSSSKKKSTSTSGAAGSSGSAATDLKVVALAAGLENLAVQVYQAGIDAASAGRLGSVPPAVVTFAQTAQSQHKDHAAAWNGVLTSAGKPAVSGVDTTVKQAVTDPALAQVTDVPKLATLALQLENVAAATYLEGIGVVTSPAGIKTAASIHPVEMQHAAILGFVLGQYPVPNDFATTDGARPLTDQIG